MEQRKRGRPRTKHVAVWEEKYYRLSDMRDNQAIRKTVEDRIYKGFASLFTLAHEREPNQRDVGTINKQVAGIIDKI